MGKFQGTGYVNEFSAKLTDRGHKAPAAANVQVAEPEPKVERKAKVVPVVTNTGNTGAVTNAVAKDTTNAARQSRWRSKQDVVALRGQAKERMKGLRARRKAGKAVGS